MFSSRIPSYGDRTGEVGGVALSGAVMRLAEVEGLDAHKRAVTM
jgi:histidinol dehydrogenase